MQPHRSPHALQSGQAIFVIALIMVGLIGALGLAVDGGGMAFLYRDAQNAADSAALAAAYARCTNGNLTTITNAALASAEDNGFVNAGTTQITVVPGADPNLISVSVRAVKPAYFIQLVFPRGLEVTASATAQCTPALTGTQAEDNRRFSVIGLGQTGGVSATCHSSCDAIEGMNVNFDANGFSATGADGSVIENASNWKDGATLTLNGTPQDPLSYLDISDYAPNGDIWNNIPDTQRTYLQLLPGTPPTPVTVPNFTYVRNSSQAWGLGVGNRPQQDEWRVTDPTKLSGLYYVEGNIVIDMRNKSASPFTIVATGRIDFRNASKGLSAYPQASNILAYSAAPSQNCNDNVLTVAEGALTTTGILYAPNGQIEVLYTSGTYNGAIVGKWVDWWGYSSTATTFRAMPVTMPPIVALVS